MNKQNFESFFVVISFYFILSIIIKFFLIDSLVIIFSTSLFEYFLLLLLFFIFSFLRFPQIIISFFIFFSIWLFLLQSYFIVDLIQRKDSLMATNFEVLKFFFIEILPVSFLFLTIMVVVFLFFLKKMPPISLSVKKKLQVLLFFISFFIVFLIPNVFSNNFSNVYVSTTSSLKNSFLYDPVVFNSEIEPFLYEESSQKNISLNKKKYFIFVMEGVDYQEVQSQRYPGDILDVMGDSLIEYSNFYTQNQDSRTSLMSFLSGTFIPYEAYLYNFEYVYGHVFNQSSFLDVFMKNSYATHYIISSMELPEIGFKYSWDYSHSLDTFPIENFTCVHQIANQRACEDEVLLDETLFLLLDNTSSLIFQEGVYGHGSDFFDLEKKNSYVYYSEYLKKIFFELKSQQKLDDVKIVLVSDHGSKGRDSMETIEGYHIPLYIYDSNFTSKKVDSFYTHLDLEELILGVPVEQREEIFIVGSTMSQLVIYYNLSDYAFMNFGKRPYIFKKSNSFLEEDLFIKFSSFKNYQRDYFRE